MCNVPLTLRWYSLAYGARGRWWFPRARDTRSRFIYEERVKRAVFSRARKSISRLLPGPRASYRCRESSSTKVYRVTGAPRARRGGENPWNYFIIRQDIPDDATSCTYRKGSLRTDARCIRNTIVRVPRRSSIRGWSISLSRTVRTGSQARKYTIPRLAQVKIFSLRLVPSQPVYHFPRHFQLISRDDIVLYSSFILSPLELWSNNKIQNDKTNRDERKVEVSSNNTCELFARTYLISMCLHLRLELLYPLAMYSSRGIPSRLYHSISLDIQMRLLFERVNTLRRCVLCTPIRPKFSIKAAPAATSERIICEYRATRLSLTPTFRCCLV